MTILEQHRELAEALLEQAHKFYALKLQMSDGGNLSVRVPDTDRMIVKGSNADFGSLRMNQLAVMDFNGRSLEGGKPSKESLLHGAIYRAFPGIGAVLHCHSPWATAFAANHEELSFSTHHAKLKLGGLCPVFDTQSYVVPGDRFPMLLSAMEQHPQMKAFLLRGHGQVAWGATIRDAAMIAELVEETAMIALIAAAGR
jgi:L-ribulose-5-phosphate 4-epimerase